MNDRPHYPGEPVLAQLNEELQGSRHLSKTLRDAAIPREVFDPKNAKHRAVYLVFRQTGRWLMHFHPEHPRSVPQTIESKLLDMYLQRDEERAARLLNATEPEPVAPSVVVELRRPQLNGWKR